MTLLDLLWILAWGIGSGSLAADIVGQFTIQPNGSEG